MKKVKEYWASLKTKVLSDLHIHYDMIYYLRKYVSARIEGQYHSSQNLHTLKYKFTSNVIIFIICLYFDLHYLSFVNIYVIKLKFGLQRRKEKHDSIRVSVGENRNARK